MKKQKIYGCRPNRDYGGIPLRVEAMLRSIATRDNREAKARAKAKRAAESAKS